MDEVAEIYWIDDERNAVVHDHRKGSGGSVSVGSAISSSRPTISNHPRTQSAVVRYPSTSSTRHPIVMSSPKTTLFGGIGLGSILDMAAQILAALQSLPAAPVATGDVAKDVANLTTYQSSLASHAKQDERIRTIGSLVNRLVK